jgi:type I restriction enzyme S subunit
MSFKEVTSLGSVVKCLDSKRIPLSSKERESKQGHYPYYGAAGIIDYVNEPIFSGLYLLMGEDGSVIKEDGTPVLQLVSGEFWVNNHAHVLQGETDLETRFLYYALGNTNIQGFVTGAVQPKLNQANMNKIPVYFPGKSIRKRIVEILGSLDDKIELNRQTNATLEAIAQAIFKEWFVDFNYPGATGEMVESELGMIPKGWRVGKLEHISDTIDCLHSKKPERLQEKTGHLLLQLWNILDSGHIDLKDPYWITQDDYLKWISRIEAVEGVSVITNVGRSGVAARIPASLKAALGRNMTSIRVKRDFPFDVYLILLLKSPVMAKEIEGKLDPGTIMDSLNVRNIPLLRFVRPPIELVAAFEEIVKPIWIKTDENIFESALLEQVRDILLPKLMSGEIKL